MLKREIFYIWIISMKQKTRVKKMVKFIESTRNKNQIGNEKSEDLLLRNNIDSGWLDSFRHKQH